MNFIRKIAKEEYDKSFLIGANQSYWHVWKIAFDACFSRLQLPSDEEIDKISLKEYPIETGALGEDMNEESRDIFKQGLKYFKE